MAELIRDVGLFAEIRLHEFRHADVSSVNVTRGRKRLPLFLEGQAGLRGKPLQGNLCLRHAEGAVFAAERRRAIRFKRHPSPLQGGNGLLEVLHRERERQVLKVHAVALAGKPEHAVHSGLGVPCALTLYAEFPVEAEGFLRVSGAAQGAVDIEIRERSVRPFGLGCAEASFGASHADFAVESRQKVIEGTALRSDVDGRVHGSLCRGENRQIFSERRSGHAARLQGDVVEGRHVRAVDEAVPREWASVEIRLHREIRALDACALRGLGRDDNAAVPEVELPVVDETGRETDVVAEAFSAPLIILNRVPGRLIRLLSPSRVFFPRCGCPRLSGRGGRFLRRG